MRLTPFHALYTAAELRKHTSGAARLLPALSAANMEVYPFQIASAMFALRSTYLKGAILADEGSLGKRRTRRRSNRYLLKQSRHELDAQIDTAAYVRRAAAETSGERKDEIDRLTEQARLQKLALTRDIERLQREIKQAEIDKGGNIADRIDAEKRRAAMTREIKQREQSVFIKKCRKGSAPFIFVTPDF